MQSHRGHYRPLYCHPKIHTKPCYALTGPAIEPGYALSIRSGKIVKGKTHDGRYSTVGAFPLMVGTRRVAKSSGRGGAVQAQADAIMNTVIALRRIAGRGQDAYRPPTH